MKPNINLFGFREFYYKPDTRNYWDNWKIFLNVAQALDKVWHGGLEHKSDILLPQNYTQLLKSYYGIKQDEVYTELKVISSRRKS